MVVFPNAKINLGLNILSRRTDGYHNLDMVMAPVGWSDILEIVPAKGDATTLTVTGHAIACPMEKNLVYKAWQALDQQIARELPAVDIYLHKVIPDGAGLGGGSSDAAFTLTALNKLFDLGLNDDVLSETASTLGADCPFFIHNRPMLCSGTGTEMRPIDVNWGSCSYIVIAKPKGVSVSTAEAYAGVTPQMPAETVDQIVTQPPETWRNRLVNGFEDHIFRLKPRIGQAKQALYDCGAVYASMSGSGAAVYGLFADEQAALTAAQSLDDCHVYMHRLNPTW